MSKKKIYATIMLLLFAVLSNILILKFVRISSIEDVTFDFYVDFKATEDDYIQVYYSDKLEFDEENSVMVLYESEEEKTVMSFRLENHKPYLRVDLGNKPLDIEFIYIYDII